MNRRSFVTAVFAYPMIAMADFGFFNPRSSAHDSAVAMSTLPHSTGGAAQGETMAEMLAGDGDIYLYGKTVTVADVRRNQPSGNRFRRIFGGTIVGDLWRVFGGELYCRDVTFRGIRPWTLYLDAPALLVCENCTFIGSPSAGITNNGSRVWVYNSRISDCLLDGVGSHQHAQTGYPAEHVIVDTVIERCGVDGSNRNAVSMHEAGTEVLRNVVARDCYGPAIISTGPGISLWQCCTAHAARGFPAFDTYGGRTVYMEGCFGIGGSSYVRAGSTIYGRDNDVEIFEDGGSHIQWL